MSYVICLKQIFNQSHYQLDSPLIKQAKKPKWNLLAITNINAVAYYKTVFNSFYLFETFIFSSHFEKLSAINYQIALIGHRKFMIYGQLRGKVGLAHNSILNFWS